MERRRKDIQSTESKQLLFITIKNKKKMKAVFDNHAHASQHAETESIKQKKEFYVFKDIVGGISYVSTDEAPEEGVVVLSQYSNKGEKVK